MDKLKLVEVIIQDKIQLSLNVCLLRLCLKAWFLREWLGILDMTLLIIKIYLKLEVLRKLLINLLIELKMKKISF